MNYSKAGTFQFGKKIPVLYAINTVRFLISAFSQILIHVGWRTCSSVKNLILPKLRNSFRRR